MFGYLDILNNNNNNNNIKQIKSYIKMIENKTIEKYKNMMHIDVIKYFSNNLFEGILTEANIVSKKKAIKLKDDIDTIKHYGYFMEKNKETYFLPSDYIKELPIKILNKKEVDYQTDVFYLIDEIETVKIPAKKILTFREMIDLIANFKHSNPMQFLLYKIIITTAIIDRINFRVISKKGFGKDSVVDIFQMLHPNIVNQYGASYAKMEFILRNKFILFNEIGNLKEDDKYNFQNFFLATGSFFPIYSKRTRKTLDVEDEFDISQLSVGIAYNTPDYYIEKGQEYFDMIFTSAVTDRFIPFLFEGVILTEFGEINEKQLSTEYSNIYKSIISTLTWFKQNPIENKYKLPETTKFENERKRYKRTFKVIAKYISEYAENEQEYVELITELYKAYQTYINTIVEDQEQLQEEEDIPEISIKTNNKSKLKNKNKTKNKIKKEEIELSNINKTIFNTDNKIMGEEKQNETQETTRNI